jgi:hypothetical protein
VTVTDLLKGERRFVDVDPATADGKTILRMVDAGYVEPIDADYFGPADPVTRAQLARASVLVTSPVADPPSKGEEVDFQALAVSADLLSPPTSGSSGDTPINRLQLAQVLARMARAKGYGTQDGSAATSDLIDVPAYARSDVAVAVNLGLITPKSPTRLGVYALPERRQLAVILSRFQDLPVVGPSTLVTASNDATPPASGAVKRVQEAPYARANGAWHGLVMWLAGAFILGGLLVALRLRVAIRRQRRYTAGDRGRSRKGHT